MILRNTPPEAAIEELAKLYILSGRFWNDDLKSLILKYGDLETVVAWRNGSFHHISIYGLKAFGTFTKQAIKIFSSGYQDDEVYVGELIGEDVVSIGSMDHGDLLLYVTECGRLIGQVGTAPTHLLEWKHCSGEKWRAVESMIDGEEPHPLQSK